MIALLVNLLIVCLILGLVWWISTLFPLPPPLRIAVNVILGIIAIVFLLSLLGVVPGPRFIHVR